jgi:hypothetical protein
MAGCAQPSFSLSSFPDEPNKRLLYIIPCEPSLISRHLIMNQNAPPFPHPFHYHGSADPSRTPAAGVSYSAVGLAALPIHPSQGEFIRIILSGPYPEHPTKTLGSASYISPPGATQPIRFPAGTPTEAVTCASTCVPSSSIISKRCARHTSAHDSFTHPAIPSLYDS